MKKFLETVGFLVFVQGVVGLLYEWTGWFRLCAVIARIDFVDDHGLYVNLVLVVAGVAVMVAADSVRT
ncbi:hypothetical protein ACIRD8_11655 [Streptomyces sp. NPDC102451]|uniref:hypothetical protein n=1 Tax=Streptomyces sp. NPDC102451 TaxID=3366177 RepID=UPI003826593E